MKKSQREIYAEAFANYVIDGLKRTRINQAELARRSSLTPQAISQIVNKKPHSLTGKLLLPERETVERIAQAFGDPVAKARRAAGYSEDQVHSATIEEALNNALFFDGKGLSEADKEKIRPLLQVVDREIDRLKEGKDE